MDIFWVIKVINKDGTRGYIMDTPKGLMIITNGIAADVTQFKTYQDAQQFIRDRKIERRGVKAYIRDSNDLIKDEVVGISSQNTSIYHLENHKEEKCFYDSAKEVYFFKTMGDVGYPVWNDEKAIRLFVKEMKFQQSGIYMVKHDGKKALEKKLIQVFGSKKGEDGVLSEPEHIEINETDATIQS